MFVSDIEAFGNDGKNLIFIEFLLATDLQQIQVNG